MHPSGNIGGLIKRRRGRLGLTQDALALRVACATITIRKIEANQLRPSVQMAERIAEALELPLEKQPEFIHAARAISPHSPSGKTTPKPSLFTSLIGTCDLSGWSIGGMDLAERAGLGALGVVYRAVQPQLGRDVAIKFFHPTMPTNARSMQSLETEAKLLARLEHPHIVPLYDFQQEGGIPYLVNRFFHGGCLADRISADQPAMPVPFILEVLEQIASALDYAHRLGMVHSDIKPRNIMLDEDSNAYLSDFGIAKFLLKSSSEDRAQDEGFKGTPAYASPEQFNFQPVTPQSDVYSMGIMIYEMLCGCLPFQASTPWGYCLLHTSESLPSADAINPELAPIIDPILRKATAKDPQDRFPDVPSLVLTLEDALVGIPVSMLEYGSHRIATPLELSYSEVNGV